MCRFELPDDDWGRHLMVVDEEAHVSQIHSSPSERELRILRQEYPATHPARNWAPESRPVVSSAQ